MEPTTITLQDLTVVVSIIDVCSERGAFKGNELMVVGQIREKIAAFVKQNQPQEEKKEQTTEENEQDAA
jgi:hypothetical protein